MNDFLFEIIEKEISTLFEAINEESLDEGSYSKLLRSLAGLEEGIHSVGIITAENPMAQKFSNKDNKNKNKELARNLRDLGYGFYQVKGKYGNEENPLVVPNITKKDLIFLGEYFEQDSVIYVEKTENGSIAELIETHGDLKTVSTSVVLPIAQNEDDFYTLYKGRKFTIPFFDDFFKDKELVKGRVIDKKNNL